MYPSDEREYQATQIARWEKGARGIRQLGVFSFVLGVVFIFGVLTLPIWACNGCGEMTEIMQVIENPFLYAGVLLLVLATAMSRNAARLGQRAQRGW